MIFLAGQIGLVPGCMTLVPAKIEATVSLDHVISVLKVKGSDLSHILQGVCYCTSLEAVQYAQMAWQKVYNGIATSLYATMFICLGCRFIIVLSHCISTCVWSPKRC